MPRNDQLRPLSLAWGRPDVGWLLLPVLLLWVLEATPLSSGAWLGAGLMVWGLVGGRVAPSAGTAEGALHRARQIVAGHGRCTLAYGALLPDKRHFFSPSGESVLAYVRKGRAAVVFGEPIGPAEDRAETVRAFLRYCDVRGIIPTFYNVGEAGLSLYEALGLRVMPIGERAMVDLAAFSLEGRASKPLRKAMHRMERVGYRLEIHRPPLSAELLGELAAVSAEWLGKVSGAERRFSMGWFDEAYLRDCTVAAAYAPDGRMTAFVNMAPSYQGRDVAADLMRRRAEAEHGTVEALYVTLFEHSRAEGHHGFDMGLSLASLDLARSGLPLPGWAWRGAHAALRRCYNVEGIHEFKKKFHPRWEARYLVFPGRRSLFEVLFGLVRAGSGDRLLAYLKRPSGRS